MLCSTLLVACVGLASRTWAHGDLHVQIVELTKKIAQAPEDAELYLKRGELHRLHRDWDSALADFERVRSLPRSTNEVMLDFVLGRLYQEATWARSAVFYLSRHLQGQPQHIEAFVLRGRARVQLEEFLAAAEDLTQAITLSPRPGPELFVERSRAWAAAGPDHQQRAIAGLDEGIKMLGPLVTLELPALELEVKAKAFEGALKRVDKLSAQSPRKETWLKRRGDILMEAGRTDEARRAFQSALDALDTLPPPRRNVPAMVELEKELRARLRSLAPSGAERRTAPVQP